MRIAVVSAAFLCFIAVGLPTSAGAAGRPAAGSDYVVAEVPSISMGGGANVVVSQVDHQICVNPPPAFVCLPSWTGISVADEGTTLWVDATSPTDVNDFEFTPGVTSFEDFVGYITNGDPDWIVSGLMMGGGAGGAGEPEATFFDGAAGPSGVDLAGYVIDRIGFRVDSISIDSPGTDPNGDGVWTDASLSGTYVFEGHIANAGACARDGWESLHAADGGTFSSLVACARYAVSGG